MSIARLDEVRAAFREALAAAGSDPEALERVRVAYAGQRSGLLRDLAQSHRLLVTLEENAVAGGAGAGVAEAVAAGGLLFDPAQQQSARTLRSLVP